MIALLCPGQGMEEAAMGLSLAEACGPARLLLQRASEHVGLDLRRALARGGRALTRTDVLQPCLAAVTLGAVQLLEQRGVIGSVLVAGHSCGETAAAAVAGWFSAEEALDVATLRGALMAREARRSPGTMLAISTRSGQHLGVLLPVLRAARRCGSLVFAAHNAPGQWVVSGDAAAAAVARRYGARALAVSGAWHSPAMRHAVAPLQRALERRTSHARAARQVLVSNRYGRPVGEDEPRARLLAEQLVRPVRWLATLRTLAAAGVRAFVTVGPGRVLRSLVRRGLGTRALVLGSGDLRQLDQTTRALTRLRQGDCQ